MTKSKTPLHVRLASVAAALKKKKHVAKETTVQMSWGSAMRR